MTLNDSQKLKVKKHLGYDPFTIAMDSTFNAIDGAPLVTNAVRDAITACDTALDAVTTAENDSDSLQSGGGASFNYSAHIGRRKEAYRRTQEELSRLVAMPIIEREESGTSTVGWFGGC